MILPAQNGSTKCEEMMSMEERLRAVSEQRGIEVDDMLNITRWVLDALLVEVRRNAPRATATIEATEYVMRFVPHSLGHLREVDRALKNGA